MKYLLLIVIAMCMGCGKSYLEQCKLMCKDSGVQEFHNYGIPLGYSCRCKDGTKFSE